MIRLAMPPLSSPAASSPATAKRTPAKSGVRVAQLGYCRANRRISKTEMAMIKRLSTQPTLSRKLPMR